MSRQADARRFEDVTTVRVGSLATPVDTCEKSDSIADVYERMKKRQHSIGAVVLDQTRCVGWLTSDRINAMYAHGETEAPVGTASVVSCPIVGPEVTLAEAMEISASRTDDESVMALRAIVGRDAQIETDVCEVVQACQVVLRPRPVTERNARG